MTGFNVDLARAICAELEVRCTIQARPWDDLQPSLQDRRSDAAIAGIAITPGSRASLAFTAPYLMSPARFVARTADAFAVSPRGLAGRKIGVVAGTAHAAYVAATFAEAAVQALPTEEAARTALRTGAVDLLFGDGVQLAFWLQSEAAAGCCGFVGGAYLDETYFGEGMAIAVRPEDGDLRRALDAALQAIQADGRYGELYLRYFPISAF